MHLETIHFCFVRWLAKSHYSTFPTRQSSHVSVSNSFGLLLSSFTQRLACGVEENRCQVQPKQNRGCRLYTLNNDTSDACVRMCVSKIQTCITPLTQHLVLR